MRPSVVALWEELGWKRNGNVYRGHFLVKDKAYRGVILQNGSDFEVYMDGYPPEFRSDPHWSCLNPANIAKFKLHLNKKPKDVGSAIINTQLLLGRRGLL